LLEKLRRVNPINLIISVFFLAGWYFLYSQVRLAADDYMYAFFSENALTSTVSYYFVGNGRFFINLIETLLFKLDRYALIVIIPPVMIALAALISKLVNMLSGSKNKYVFVAALASLAAMDVLLAQEVFYWLSGAVTYLFSSVMFVASIIIFLYLKQNPDVPKGKKAVLVILCVLCALSMEQFALMTTGFIFFSLVYELITTKKIKKLHILIFVLCAVATLSSLLAPASLVRLGDNSTAEAGMSVASLVTSLMDAVFFNYSSSSAIRFVLIISLMEAALFIRSKRIFWAAAGCVEVAAVLVIHFARVESFVLVAFSLALFLVTTVAALITTADNKESAFGAISLLVLAYMSQVFMLVDNLHHDRIYRISYTVIIVYIILTAYFASKIGDAKAAAGVCVLLLAFISLYAMAVALLTLVVFTVFVKDEKLNSVAMGVIALAVIAWSLIPNARALAPYARLADYNEAQLRSGKDEIVIHCVREDDMDVIYYPNYLVRISEDNLSNDGGYYKKFTVDYDGNIFRHYYGLDDDQTVRIEYIEGSVSDFLESVGY
jgi:hypothetical protein